MNTYTNSLCLKITIASILWLALKIPVHAQPTLAAVETKEVWGDQKEKLNQSLQQWLKLKKECQGNYSYEVKWSSWTGFGNTTTIVVKNNKVIERRYESYGAPHPDGRPIDKNRWTERGEFIGSSAKGYPPRTIDELYKEAKSLTDRPIPPFHRAVIRVNKAGLLLSCYIQDTRIADDAPTEGINITSISLENENKTVPAKPTRPILKPAKRKPYPEHWGAPPKRQTRDLRPLPGGYGMGSGTLARWIQENLDRDKNRSTQPD